MTDRGEFVGVAADTNQLVENTPESVASYVSPESTSRDHSLLHDMNSQLDVQVKFALAEKKETLSSIELPLSGDYAINGLEDRVNLVLEELLGEGAVLRLDRPSIKGKRAAGDSDLTTNVAALAKKFNLPLAEITARVVEVLADEEMVESVEISGPFINIKIRVLEMSEQVLGAVGKGGEHYGWYRNGEPEVVVVDYSSPNVAKNLTVAHLRSTIIGQSLVRLQEASGNIPFGINHIGDWGTQFGNIIYQYHKERIRGGIGFMNQLSEDPSGTLMQIYRNFNKEVKELPQEDREKVLDAGRQIFLELENGHSDHVELWEKFREWSLANFAPVYERLNDVSFDAIQGESFYEGMMGQVVAEALDRGVLKRAEDGSVVFPSQELVDPATMKVNSQIMLDKDGNPRDEIIVKPSGGTVYMTRDLAAIIYRVRELGAQKMLYVIGKEQGAHCIEVFNMAHQMGAIALGEAQHISFGHLNVDGRKMKSREGKVVLLEDLLDDVSETAQEIIDAKDRTEEYQGLAEQTGVNSVIFNDLKQDRVKDIEFDPERDIPKMLTAGGAIYIQYTHARLNSLLERALDAEIKQYVEEDSVEANVVYEAHKIERDILMLIAMLPRVIEEAAESNAPHKVATYLTELSQAVNTFQADRQLRVIDAENNQAREFRINLMAGATQVVRNAAKLLHTQLPERM